MTQKRCSEDFEERRGNGNMTIRYYRHPEDLSRIRQLFVDATTQGQGSPVIEGMRRFTPHTRLAYFAFVLGIALTAVSRLRWIEKTPWIAPASVCRSGMFLCSAAIVMWIYVWYHRRIIKRAFRVFLDKGLNRDLGDVVKFFDLRITDGGICVPTGPSGFWIAEEAGEIIGIIGLSNKTGPDPTVGDVRRLAVSCNHRGRRIAEKLMDAVVSHARANKLRVLGLVTSPYNKSALRFYPRIGWEVVGRKDWEGLSLVVMQQELDGGRLVAER